MKGWESYIKGYQLETKCLHTKLVLKVNPGNAKEAIEL